MEISFFTDFFFFEKKNAHKIAIFWAKKKFQKKFTQINYMEVSLCTLFFFFEKKNENEIAIF